MEKTMTKVCTKCLVEQDVSEFKKKKGKSGEELKHYVSRCKNCDYKYNKEYRKQNREKVKATTRRYFEKNKKIAESITIKSKVCVKCLIEKDISEFHKLHTSKTGYNPRCKECKKPVEKKVYKPDPGIKTIVCTKCLVEKNVSEFHKQKYNKSGYRSWCKPCRKKVCQKYYKDNLEAKKIYRQKNKGKHKGKYRGYALKYRQNNPLRVKISSSIRSALKRRGSSKNGAGTWKDILPYTPKDLKDHFESLFKPGMTWENHGNGPEDWSIDHVIPDSKFTYKTIYDEGFKQSWALSNLQPMWHRENISKGNRYSGDYCSDPPVQGGHVTVSPRSQGFVFD